MLTYPIVDRRHDHIELHFGPVGLLGSAEITHPFHPLRGQRFVVLKVRTVSGVETLSLRQAELGSFAVAREWTDWAPPGAQAVPSDGKALLIDASGLLALDQLVASLTRTVKLDQ